MVFKLFGKLFVLVVSPGAVEIVQLAAERGETLFEFGRRDRAGANRPPDGFRR